MRAAFRGTLETRKLFPTVAEMEQINTGATQHPWPVRVIDIVYKHSSLRTTWITTANCCLQAIRSDQIDTDHSWFRTINVFTVYGIEFQFPVGFV